MRASVAGETVFFGEMAEGAQIAFKEIEAYFNCRPQRDLRLFYGALNKTRRSPAGRMLRMTGIRPVRARGEE